MLSVSQSDFQRFSAEGSSENPLAERNNAWDHFTTEHRAQRQGPKERTFLCDPCDLCGYHGFHIQVFVAQGLMPISIKNHNFFKDFLKYLLTKQCINCIVC
jgi:hypothetical protein